MRVCEDCDGYDGCCLGWCCQGWTLESLAEVLPDRLEVDVGSDNTGKMIYRDEDAGAKFLAVAPGPVGRKSYTTKKLPKQTFFDFIVRPHHRRCQRWCQRRRRRSICRRRRQWLSLCTCPTLLLLATRVVLTLTSDWPGAGRADGPPWRAGGEVGAWAAAGYQRLGGLFHPDRF